MMTASASRLTMHRDSKHEWWAWLVCLLLTILKLWLTSGQTVAAIGGSLYDDFHFLTQAQYLLNGQCLGPYDQLTLIKGPFFRAWPRSL